MNDDALEERLRRHVVVLSELIGPRHTGQPEALRQTREYITQQLHTFEDEPNQDEYVTSQRRALNIEVSRPGASAEKSALVIGAHYDTVPTTPGADDNASAVAVLLELLNAIRNISHRRTVHAVFYDCEEPPHYHLGEMGSQHHAAKMQRNGENLFGMICLESVGYFGPPLRAGCNILPWWLDRLQQILVGSKSIVAASNVRSTTLLGRMLPGLLSLRGVAIRPVVAPPNWIPAIELSDHRGYWEQGYRAVMLTDTAMLRNPHYHEPSDTVSTLDFPRMARFCRQVTRCVRRLIK